MLSWLGECDPVMSAVVGSEQNSITKNEQFIWPPYGSAHPKICFARASCRSTFVIGLPRPIPTAAVSLNHVNGNIEAQSLLADVCPALSRVLPHRSGGHQQLNHILTPSTTLAKSSVLLR
jgi:hypothetical protein